MECRPAVGTLGPLLVRAAATLAAAALLFAGCDDAGNSRSQGAKDAAAARLAKAEARPTGLEAAMIGRWASDRSCGDAIVYVADGDLGLPADPAGAPRTSRWSVAAADRVTWTRPDGRSTFRVTELEPDSHTTIAEDGRRRRYVRC